MYLYIQENNEAFYSQDPPTTGDIECIREGILSVFTPVGGRMCVVRPTENGYNFQEVSPGKRFQHVDSGWVYSFPASESKRLAAFFEPVEEPQRSLPFGD